MLTTAAVAKRHPAFADFPDTTYLEELLETAGYAIESYCNRQFATVEYGEKHDGDDTYVVDVKNPPITTLSNVIVTLQDGTTETHSSAEFTIANDRRIRYAAGQDAVLFPLGYQNVQVDYIGGYSTIPMDVQQACIVAAHNLYRRTANPYEREEPADNPVLTPDIKAMLAKYRILTV